MNRIHLLLLFSLTSSILFAQNKSYSSGYIIKQDGNKIEGLIRKSALIDLSETVQFKKDQSSEVQKFSPEEVQSFYFENKQYEADSIPFLDDQGRIFFKHLFLQKLLEGRFELYRLDHQINDAPSPLYQYQNKFYYLRTDTKQSMIDLLENNYKIKLGDLFRRRNCEEGALVKTKFTDAAIAGIVQKLNTCLGADSKRLFVEKKKKKVKLGIGLGISSHSIATNNGLFDKAKTESNIGVDANFYLYWSLSRKIDIRGGLGYKNRSQTGEIPFIIPEGVSNSGETITLNSEIKINQAYTVWEVLYAFSSSKTKPYILAGAYFGVATGNSAYLETAEYRFENGAGLYDVKGNNPYDATVNAIEVGFSAGLGVAFPISEKQGLFFELKYLSGQNDSTSEQMDFISNQNYQLNVGFTF